MKLYEPISARNLKKKLKSRILDEQGRYIDIDMFIIHIYIWRGEGEERGRDGGRERASLLYMYIIYVIYYIYRHTERCKHTVDTYFFLSSED